MKCLLGLIPFAVAAAVMPARGQARDSTAPAQPPAVQVTDSSVMIWLADDYPVTRARLAEIRGAGPHLSLLRSTSSLLWTTAGETRKAIPLPPQLTIVNNSAIPYSRNNGSLWAGHGGNVRVTGGAAFSLGALRVILAPEITASGNDSIPPRLEIVPTPPIPAGRSGFAYPWYANGPYSIDMPLRFGDKARKRLSPGQSSILAELGKVAFGFSTENEWWGPGIDNALILSNNAPGFPHLLLRSSHPLASRIGEVEFRWLVGGLTESPFFDDNPDNNTRSLASAAVTLRPRGVPDLSVGMARSVVGTSTGWSEIPFRWLDVFHNTGHPSDGAPYDSTLRAGGRDQIVSMFARWVLPASGAEVYGEWGRLDLPRNLRDAVVQPNRGLAYTLGLQWTRQAFTPTGIFHVRLENTSLEQSLATRERFAGVWYTSRRVLQGFTNEGEVLGAAVGPGSSGQTAEMNYFGTRGFFGLEFGRTRYNEDVHQNAPMEYYLRWCSHDVDLQWGFHGGVNGRAGRLALRTRFQDRLNAYFQGGHGCPRSDGMVDIRNANLTITFSPFAR